MTRFEQYDAVIIGGGPAGASAATVLRRLDRRVLVLEKERFPRHHVGESMVGSVRALLRALGVAEEMEAVGFVRKHGSTHVWGNSFDVWSIYFNEDTPAKGYSYQVDRAIFDEVLLRHAARSGADVREGAVVTDVCLDDPNEIVVSYQTDGGAQGQVRASYLIDASGQRRFLAQRKRLVETHFDPHLHNMAVYGYFAGSQLLRGVDQTNFLLEAFPRGWAWHIPLHTGRASVGMVVGQDSLPELRAAGPDGFLASQIEETRVLRELLAQAEPVSPARVINDGSYQVDHFGGDRFLLAGDAACFIDPMFAPGVALALQSGIYAGATINFALSHSERWPEVCALYEEEFARAYHNARQAVLLSYSVNDLFNDSPFWRERKLSEEQQAVMAGSSHFMYDLSPDGALSYERKSLHYSDLPPTIAEALTRLDRDRAERERVVREVMQDLGNWVPDWSPSTTRRRQLGFPRIIQSLDLVEGIMATNETGRQFIGDPPTLMACDLIDGHRSIRDIIGEVLARVPENERLHTNVRLLNGFVLGFYRGLFETSRVERPIEQPA